MLRTYTLGTIRDIHVRVHPSFAILALLLVTQQGIILGGNVSAFLFATLLMALLFGCVLLHEFGHSFMAMHYGLRVYDITLWPIGGVARIEQIPTRPGAETLVSLAGPAVNLAITVALVPVLMVYSVARGYTSIAGLLDEALAGPGVGALLLYLLLLNVVLILFNLLPTFPMDGGRVLRAMLSHRLGRERATSIAVWIGQAMAVVMIVVGLWQWIPSLPLIGVFVIVAARSEGRAVRLESAMRRLHVGQFALWDMGGLSPNHPITFAFRGGLRDWAVIENGQVVGMVWRNQLLPEMNASAGDRTVASVMDRDVVTADINDSVYDVQQWMHRANRWALPVTEGGVYRGIFTADRFVHVYRHLNSDHPRWPQMITNLVRRWSR